MDAPHVLATRTHTLADTHTRIPNHRRHPGCSEPGDEYCFTIQYLESDSHSTANTHGNAGKQTPGAY
jgi:hypothetical protein